MRFSVLLAATAATIVAAQADLGNVQNCKNPQGLLDCAKPYFVDVNNCGSNIPCLCKAATGGQQCFTKYCPEVTFPYSAELQSECGSSGSGSGSGTGSGTGSGSGSGTSSGSSTGSTNAPTNSNSNNAPKSGGGVPGAGASIFAPAGSLLAAIVAVAAML
ncbi:hypothetical protein VC83_03695 [Pseudogymnoascus destructans]|uniref:Extracellular membrane protein CFEM domain-containing protein n=2 Tax=Pseudogymnoascus destructans TaxID=655981 RepID=L8G489_PSED2|nr:uncharacterized protein VC83_03695 [Pseudogymnoascus destructans]ELR07594.1 hypothetical protein GMDG_02642 [Pseudogymnoascus destructans 20631-21]OAF59841.1 hypothetical protein VC83_03695 [Pseudogymnoascus destructans]